MSIASRSFNFSDPALFDDPYPIYREMRETDPVHHSSMYGGSWIIFRYGDAVDLLRGGLLTNDRSLLPTQAVPEGERERFGRLLAILKLWTGFRVGDAYGARRRHLNDVFRHVAPPDVQKITEEVVEDVLDGWDGEAEVDLVDRLAHPVAARVLTRLVGAPEQDHAQLAAWTADLSYLFATDELDVDALLRAERSAEQMLAYFLDVAPGAAPCTPDVLHRMSNTSTEGFRFSRREAAAQAVMLMFAGLEPTQDLVGNAVLALDRAPDQRELLREDDTRWPIAVDELLRFDPPVQYIGRMAATSFEYRGHRMQAGQPVLPLVGSTNRDPDAFDAPDRLDVLRRRKHLALGEGVHRCLGASVLRTQTAATLRTLARRHPRLSVTGPPVWKSYAGFHGLHALPVRLGA